MCVNSSRKKEFQFMWDTVYSLWHSERMNKSMYLLLKTHFYRHWLVIKRVLKGSLPIFQGALNVSREVPVFLFIPMLCQALLQSKLFQSLQRCKVVISLQDDMDRSPNVLKGQSLKSEVS